MPRPSGDLDELLSCLLDGELDLSARTDLEARLLTHPEDRARLDRLRETRALLAPFRQEAQVPAGWTLKAYKIGLPEALPPPRRLVVLGLARAFAAPGVAAHGKGLRKAIRRWKTWIRL